jgi:hypothetical protein
LVGTLWTDSQASSAASSVCLNCHPSVKVILDSDRALVMMSVLSQVGVEQQPCTLILSGVFKV